MNKYIIVNATALDRSGALSILLQFVEHIPTDKTKWLVFISSKVSITSQNPNVHIVTITGVKSFHKRLWWDTFGLKKWIRQHDIDVAAAISLQNTGFNVGKRVKNYIYYHQPLPFYPFRWNPLKVQERTFWFYKYIYPLFVSHFLKKDTKVFVQLEFIKKGFAKRFNHPTENIAVYHPAAVLIKEKRNIQNPSETLTLCYPAMDYFYKNHRIIIEALEHVKRDVKILFTLNKSKIFEDDRIECIGIQPYSKICEMYYSSDALLFPSYIETYGLPLIEAALTGLPILAADLPYAREVLSGYEGATFIPFDNPLAWAEAINALEKGMRYKPIDISNRQGWKELFNNIIHG